MMKKWIFFGLMMVLATPAFAIAQESKPLPNGFVYLDTIDPSIDQDLGFATEDNLLGVPVEGYEIGRVICTIELAHTLTKIQKEIKAQGYCLCIQDAYRPERAVKHIQRWAKDLNDQKTKARYYPDTPKKDLWGTYIAGNRSSHSRGSTIDVIFLNDTTKEPLDFGPSTFGEACFTHSSKITKEQQKNRLILRDVMLRHGFKPYDKEFWHFTLINEPFPNTYFDFPIR